MGCISSVPSKAGPRDRAAKTKPFTGDSANFESELAVKATRGKAKAPAARPATTSEVLPATFAEIRPPPTPEASVTAPTAPLAPDDNPLHSHRTYEKVDFLSDGASGFVLLAAHRMTREMVAIKFLERGSPAIKVADREVMNMQMCSMHPNIIRFREVFLTPKYLAIVTEYAELGDLAEYIARRSSKAKSGKALSENHARSLFQQIMLAVDFCHARGISNRDLKAENVLLSRMVEGKGASSTSRVVVKLCDFGFSKDEHFDSACKTACGTPEYIAPEVLTQGIYDGKQSDIWSAGVMLYVMLTGQYPFRLQSDELLNPVIALQQMFPRILSADFPKPDWLSPGCQDLLSRMMCADPSERISIEELLQHAWFRTGLQPGMLETTSTLLQVPDSLHMGFISQSQHEVMDLLAEAMHH